MLERRSREERVVVGPGCSHCKHMLLSRHCNAIVHRTLPLAKTISENLGSVFCMSVILEGYTLLDCNEASDQGLAQGLQDCCSV